MVWTKAFGNSSSLKWLACIVKCHKSNTHLKLQRVKQKTASYILMSLFRVHFLCLKNLHVCTSDLYCTVEIINIIKSDLRKKNTHVSLLAAHPITAMAHSIQKWPITFWRPGVIGLYTCFASPIPVFPGKLSENHGVSCRKRLLLNLKVAHLSFLRILKSKNFTEDSFKKKTFVNLFSSYEIWYWGFVM